MIFSTADLCDQHAGQVQIAAPLFRSYGGLAAFHGEISTIKVFEDNVLVRTALSQPGGGKVLVVDGGGSLNCALAGDQLAALAQQNGWSGIVVNGCIRDSAAIAKIRIGVRALNTHPKKSAKRGQGEKNVPVFFAGVNFVPGEQLYSDEDGMIVSGTCLM
jgi:regulator of ribonuclease activity A